MEKADILSSAIRWQEHYRSINDKIYRLVTNDSITISANYEAYPKGFVGLVHKQFS